MQFCSVESLVQCELQMLFLWKPWINNRNPSWVSLNSMLGVLQDLILVRLLNVD
ncbi:hypothetical protein QJS04_geneDACA009251 [Acorus gramineus]|uniref:Uncharacterized protein n=1 Tax=Acorus gramineus TaxID=55184 RepID=A0AAV9AGV5_ACOGR|nr:hypothetical protein QJS04_geneDACA009251 [Acorus gramineus]